jgi:uncharacterized protein YbcI
MASFLPRGSNFRTEGAERIIMAIHERESSAGRQSFQPSSSPAGEALAAISDGLVRLLSRHFGKGPTRAKTYINDNYVLCVFEDLLTTSEATLVERGRGGLVREYRLAFQEELAGEFRQVVEDATRRKVLTYHSQVVFDPPRGFEIFMLEPEPGNGGDRPAKG